MPKIVAFSLICTRPFIASYLVRADIILSTVCAPLKFPRIRKWPFQCKTTATIQADYFVGHLKCHLCQTDRFSFGLFLSPSRHFHYPDEKKVRWSRYWFSVLTHPYCFTLRYAWMMTTKPKEEKIDIGQRCN